MAPARSRILTSLGLLLGLVMFSATARGHVAASLDDNNRYFKLSLLADRVRLVYTVFFGEVPGALMRDALDKDRDGQLSDAETDAFARELGREVAGQLAVTLDGRAAAVEFATVSFGSTTRLVRGGAFSVDLIATLCMAERGGGDHRLTLRDRFRVPRPGETEVQLEDGPGITISQAALGEHRAAERVFRFAGVVPALDEPGLLVEFRVGPEAARPPASACEQQAARARARASAGLPWGALALGALGAIAALGALGAIVSWRARRRAAN